MNTEMGLPMASDAPNDDIAEVPQFTVLRGEPFPKKEISDSGYVNNAPDQAPAVPSVIEPTPDPMAVQTSVSSVLSMDDLQVVFTTNNDPHNPHNWITLSRGTPPAVVGKLVKPAKTITKKPPKEKTEAKIDHFNPDIVNKASDNTYALDDDETQVGMRSRCVWYKNGHRTVQYTSTGYAGWCGQRSVVRARSGLPYARPVQTKFKGSNGINPKLHTTMKNDAANILMSLPETGVAPAASAGVTPAGTHIEEID